MMTYFFTDRWRSIVSLLLLLLGIVSLTDACHGPYVTASSLEALHQDIHLVRPLPVDCGGLSCEFYLSAQSALGAHGPISAYGPLGTMGPIGHQFWNPTAWRGSKQKKVEDEATPILFELSDNPLSSDGPLSSKAYHETLPSINDFSKHLQGLGLWGVLGPLGPLGGLGPLGALGPTGPYNTMNLEGHHSVPVRWNRTDIRHFDLVSVLDTSHVKQPLDCSFMILGHITHRGKIDSYLFDCEPNQFVTIVLVPEHSPDHFNMTLYSAEDDSAEEIASSQSATFINFIQLAFTNTNYNGSFRIDVNLHDQDSFFVSHTYRLTVTGSQDLLDLREEEGNIQGPHIIDCDK